MSGYPWDVRIAKIADYLVASGHEVHILCRSSRGRPETEEFHGTMVHRTCFLGRNLGRLNRIADLPFPLNPLWFFRIRKLIASEGINLLIIRDIPLSLPSILAAKQAKIPTILDMAEHYAAMFRDFIADSSPLKRVPRWLLKNPIIADVVEKVAVRHTDRVFVVVEESRDRLMVRGVPAEKISIVGNTPPLSTATTGTKALPEAPKLVYVGQLQFSRGIQTVIRAISLLKQNSRDVHFYLAGWGEQGEYFKRLIAELGLVKQVHHLGFIDPEEVYELINSCDYGIIPHLDTAHIRTTIPNKLFDYMLCSKPVVVSAVGPLERIVRECGCGVAFEAGNERDLAAVLSRLIDDGHAEELGKNGRFAVTEKYNWQNDCEKISQVLKHI